MLKIKKGLKKKIKGKKDKGKEDDLFDPDQLEKFKKELEEKRRVAAESQDPEGSATASSSGQDEEWLKFKALTAGVDTILKKTTDDLDKIKETSFYQRKSNDPTNLWRPEVKGQKGKVEEVEPVEEPEDEVDTHLEEEAPQEVPEPEEVEPEPLDDSLFDTSYLDAIASGEIQLAYIPDSPTEEEGDDPFDTSGVADVCKRIEEAEKRAKRQVNLGSAADFLSGKQSTQESSNRARPRAGAPGVEAKRSRARPRAVNLLGDENSENPEGLVTKSASGNKKEPEVKKKDIFEEFDEILGSPSKEGLDAPLLDQFVGAPTSIPIVLKSPEEDNFKDILGEFDVIKSEDSQTSNSHTNTTAILKSILEPEPEEDELDDEFAALAAESVHKGPSPLPKEEELSPEEPEPEEDDPFDTTFVEKVAPTPNPTKSEGDDLNDDFDFNPRVGEHLAPGSVCPHPSPRSLLEDHSPTVESLPALDSHFTKPKGKTTTPLKNQSEDEPNPDQDPFDTSTVKIVHGKSELKQLEEELLNTDHAPLVAKIPTLLPILSAPAQPTLLDDFDFDPRADEVKEHIFDLPHDEEVAEDTQIELLAPQLEIVESEPDPFDTSIVNHLNLGPGQVELKLLESELTQVESISNPVDFSGVGGVVSQTEKEIFLKGDDEEEDDFDFDPRAGEEKDPFVVSVKQLLRTEDIFEHSDDFVSLGAKVLTPQLDTEKPVQSQKSLDEDFDDPFDTSAIEVSKLLPPSELKQIEGELLNTVIEHIPITINLKPIQSTVPQPRPIEEVELILKPEESSAEEAQDLHLLETEDLFHQEIEHKPLTPLEAYEIDPFDTSIAEKVVPGKTEIKILEQELQLGIDTFSGRRLSDPDFDPRSTGTVQQPIHPSVLSFVSKTLEPVQASESFDTTEAKEGISGTDLKALEAELL